MTDQNTNQEYVPMSYQQKNIAAALVNFSLILVFFSIRVLLMVMNDNFTSTKVFWLWGITILLSIFVTIFATILTHILSVIIQAIRTREEPEVEFVQDERDDQIDARGTMVTHVVSSIGSFVAMLTFVFGRPPLVMFTLLIFFGLLAQVIGNAARLFFYRRGF